MSNNLFYFYKSTPSLFKVIKKLRKSCILSLHSSFKISFNKDKNYYGKILTVNIVGLSWKDKWGTPRWEGGDNTLNAYKAPCVDILLFSMIRFSLRWFFDNAEYDEDDIFEQFIWINLYCHGDINKAKAEWPWTTMESDKDKKSVSTWIDIFK